MKYIYNECRGFNLIELMIALVIVSIFASVAIPTMRSLYQSATIKAETSQLIVALYLARNEAIKRQTTVVVCASVDEQHCARDATADWRNGWIVRADDVILHSKNKLNDIRIIADGPPMIRYGANGVSDLKTGVSLCSPDNREGRQVRITNTGRPYSTALSCIAST